jgi:uncharacterized membrane protein
MFYFTMDIPEIGSHAQKSDDQPGPEMARIVQRNIQALVERKRRENINKTREEKVADAVTRFAGSMLFVYIHLCLFGLWVLWNLGWIGLKPFDPSFVVLAMFASVEAIFLSTFVLISQNRASIQADKRADLDLQVSLLSEHEVTRLIVLVTQIAKKMDIKEANEAELDELSQDVHPENVMDTMEKQKEGED